MALILEPSVSCAFCPMPPTSPNPLSLIHGMGLMLASKLNLTFPSGIVMSDGRAHAGGHMHINAYRLAASAYLRIPTALQASLPAAFPDIYLPSQLLLTSCRHGEQDRMRPRTLELLPDGHGHIQADCSARWQAVHILD